MTEYGVLVARCLEAVQRTEDKEFLMRKVLGNNVIFADKDAGAHYLIKHGRKHPGSPIYDIYNERSAR